MRCNIHEGEICSACSELLQLQVKIQECKGDPIDLCVREIRLKTSINASHDLIIGRLPLEVASHIFTLCDTRPEGYVVTLFDPLLWSKSRNFPFSLAAVCTAWRKIAWCTPQLWTRTRVRLYAERAVSQKEMLALSLKLSGSFPLSLEVRLRDQYMPSEADYSILAPVIEMLNIHSERWKVLDLSLPSRLLALMKGTLPGAPRLQTLLIHCFSNSRNKTGSVFVVPGCLPSPSRVHVTGLRISQLNISWSNVTKVKMGVLADGECLEFFKLATCLVECQIGVDLGSSDLTVNGAPTTLPSLKILQLLLTEPVDRFLDKLVLPSLNILRLEGAGPFNWLERLITRSSCRLLSLIFVDTTDSDHWDIGPILQKTQHLEELTFYGEYIGGLENFFEDLARTKIVNESSQDTFLPRLQSLSYNGGNNYDYPWELISAIFPPTEQADGTQYRPLRKLDINFSTDMAYEEGDYVEVDLVPALLQLQQRGQLKVMNDRDGTDFILCSHEYHLSVEDEDEDQDDGSGDDDEGESDEEEDESDEDEADLDEEADVDSDT